MLFFELFGELFVEVFIEFTFWGLFDRNEKQGRQEPHEKRRKRQTRK